MLFRFPANEEKRQLWIAAVRRWKWHPTKYSYICSDHFLVTDYKVPPGQPRPRLAPSAVPSIFPKFPKHLMREPPKTRRKLVRKNPCLKKGAKGQQKSQTVKKPKGGKSDPNSPTKMRLRKKIKMLQQKLRRRNQKIKTMGDLIDTMKNKELLSQSSADLLKDQFSGTCLELFLNEVKNKGRKPAGRRYSEELKQFALTVNFYSHRAYNFLRKIFKLPHESSIKQWTASVNCEPGFLTEVFQDLENQSKDKPEMLDCALLIDGMSIRKQVTYDQLKSKYSGFVDYGNIIPENSENLASEALVFMLTGLKSHWKCPVGYFLTDKLNAESQASLIKTGLSLAADHGFRVWSITCDGTSTNLSTLENLGCRFTDKYDTMIVKFKHPTRDYFVYSTLDACHMLKLARNALGNLGSFKTSDWESISWKYITDLSVLQDKEGFTLANKLNSEHINWEKHKMKVKLAAQTFSSSVADALEFLKTDMNLESFQGCAATIQFIRNIDRLFDFLNSRHPMMKGFKSPIRATNLNSLKQQIQNISEYLLSLKAGNDQLLVNHRRKTFILGFVSASKSISSIAEELLMRNNDPYRFLLTYKFSQDHIELLFSCVRARGGFNNNPNTVQFKTALRQILMRNSIMASNKANVLSFEAESNGSIFYLRASKRRTPVAELLKPISEDETIESEEELHHLFGSINVTSLQENILYYISGFIIRKIIHKIDCQQCSESSVIPVSSTDHFYATMPYAMLVSRKNRGGLIQASYGALKVVEQCEKSFKMNVINSSRNQITSESNLLRKMLIQVVSVCDWQQHFPCMGDHGFEVEPGFQDDHLTQLVKKVSIRYLTMRLQTYGKRYTRQIVNSNTPSVRHQMNKLILFKNI